MPKQSLLKQNRNSPKWLSPVKLNKSSVTMAASQPLELPEDIGEIPKRTHESLELLSKAAESLGMKSIGNSIAKLLGLHSQLIKIFYEATEAKNRKIRALEDDLRFASQKNNEMLVMFAAFGYSVGVQVGLDLSWKKLDDTKVKVLETQKIDALLKRNDISRNINHDKGAKAAMKQIVRDIKHSDDHWVYPLDIFRDKLRSKSAVQAVEKKKVPPKAATLAGRPPYVYRALRRDEFIDHTSVCLKAKGEVKEATPSLKTIEMAVEYGWGPSPFIHTTTSPTAALWFARSSRAMRSSGKIAKFDLRNFEGHVYDLSEGQLLTPRSKADFFARCFEEVLLQGPPGRSDLFWKGLVKVWDVSRLQVPSSGTFRDFEAELGRFSCAKVLLHEMKLKLSGSGTARIVSVTGARKADEASVEGTTSSKKRRVSAPVASPPPVKNPTPYLLDF